jgi:hypothetical protein
LLLWAIVHFKTFLLSLYFVLGTCSRQNVSYSYGASILIGMEIKQVKDVTCQVIINANKTSKVKRVMKSECEVGYYFRKCG